MDASATSNKSSQATSHGELSLALRKASADHTRPSTEAGTLAPSSTAGGTHMSMSASDHTHDVPTIGGHQTTGTPSVAPNEQSTAVITSSGQQSLGAATTRNNSMTPAVTDPRASSGGTDGTERRYTIWQRRNTLQTVRNHQASIFAAVRGVLPEQACNVFQHDLQESEATLHKHLETTEDAASIDGALTGYYARTKQSEDASNAKSLCHDSQPPVNYTSIDELKEKVSNVLSWTDSRAISPPAGVSFVALRASLVCTRKSTVSDQSLKPEDQSVS